jgi:AcrR family transcriptional regulator
MVSPRVADPAIRAALIQAAASITADEGRHALTLRRLAREVGTSTMAIYTHFGSMDDLRREVRRAGFANLSSYLGSVRRTRDPVADLGLLGWAYYMSATGEPNLYRAMFLDGPVDAEDFGAGIETFEQLVAAVRRCVDAGRFSPADPVHLATEFWSATHGLISLQFANLLPAGEAVDRLASVSMSLYLGYGDEANAARRSMALTGKRAAAFSLEQAS